MRAIESLELKAFRDNRNRWKITPDNADIWANAQSATSAQTPSSTTSDQAVEMALLKAENSHLKERIGVLEQDLARWQNLSEKLADRPRFRWPWQR
jgi:hypothetical protein